MMNHYIFCRACGEFLEIFQIQNHVEEPQLREGYKIHENSYLIRDGILKIEEQADKKYLTCLCSARVSHNLEMGKWHFVIMIYYTHVLVQNANYGINLPLIRKFLEKIKKDMPRLLDYRNGVRFRLS